MSEYVIPATPEAREPVRQIWVDVRRRLAKQNREIGDDHSLPVVDAIKAAELREDIERLRVPAVRPLNHHPHHQPPPR
ncbi:hypothetical protein [Nonomuraea sp. NPDC049758]|uniref:hypothetical protein n=1 Tax=Nonomuraea sp. NPDC049758 TaxID=3154360 RepID=UPI003428299D